MSGHPSGGQTEADFAKKHIVEIARWIYEQSPERPDFRGIVDRLEDMSKAAWLRGWEAKKKPDKDKDIL